MPQQPLDIRPLDIQPLNLGGPATPPKRGEATLTDVITGNLPKPEPSFLESVYDSVMNAPEFVMEPARRFRDWVSAPSLATSPTGEGGFNDYMAGVTARAKGFLGGATEGAASLLSPANIATMGRGKLPQLASQLLGGGQIAHGAHEISQGNIWEGIGDIGFGTLGVATPHATPKGSPDAPLPKAPPVDAPKLDIQPLSTPETKPQGITGYHGTTRDFTTLEGGKGKGWSNYGAWVSLTENPEYAKLYSEGKFGNMTREMPKDAGTPRVIEANFNPQNVLDLTQPLTDIDRANIAEAYKKRWKKDPPSLANDDFAKDQVKGLYQILPYDAIKFAEHGQINWAVNPKLLAAADPNMNQGMGNPELAGSQPYAAKPTVESAPMGQVIMIAKDKFNANPALGVEVAKHGFEFDGVHTNGKLRFKKVRDTSGQPTPLLETDIGQTRPTQAGVKEHLGVIADKKRESALVEAFNFPRGVMASMDFSAPLRQGLGLIHKKEFWSAIKPMFKAWASEDAFRQSQQAIAERPLFRERPNPKNPDNPLPSFADDAGLKLTDLTDLSKREEAIMSTWAEKVPGVRRSNRAYVAFLNNLRADTFESLIKSGKVFGADANANLPLARELANFVNTATGRGSLGKLEQSAVALNTLFFSPRLIASRLQMMNPQYYIMANPVVRREALKSLFAIATAGNVITQLGKMAGGEVSGDPTSSDFGKLKIGNTRVDPYGGFQQYIVLASRLLSGKVTSSTSGNEYDIYNPEGPYDPSAAEVGLRFMRGKMHPVLGFAWSLLAGKKEMSGEKMDFTTMNPMENAIAQRFIPILLQDFYELSKSEELSPELKALIGTLSTFGMGSQTYGPQ